MSPERDDLVERMAKAMPDELEANVSKGDNWRDGDAAAHELDVLYHYVKLAFAWRRGDLPSVREYAADVANCAAILTNKVGALDLDSRSTDEGYDAHGGLDLRELTDELSTRIDERYVELAKAEAAT
jgi:hypothetical protein